MAEFNVAERVMEAVGPQYARPDRGNVPIAHGCSEQVLRWEVEGPEPK
jgi:hypothetical protein